MKIVFDMDGVLADFYRGFWTVANQMFGTPLEGDEHTWTWDNYGIGLTPDQADRVWDRVKQDKQFWVSLPALASYEELSRLPRLVEAGHELYFVTSRVGKNPKYQTEVWLEFVAKLRCPTVIISNRKGELCAGIGADYSIEDKAGNAVYIAYQSPKTKSYLIHAPYNYFAHDVLGKKVRRVANVTAFLNDVEAGR